MSDLGPKPRLVQITEPWTPAQATERIRRISNEDCFTITLTAHAEERLEQRDLTTLDVLYVLQKGIVLEEAVETTRPGLYKYAVICSTPNSNRRDVRVIAIPSQCPSAKIVTVMWADEK
jgi:hypothetical protein